jgi:predicted DsbA family dithiol-disulfide isomerase
MDGAQIEKRLAGSDDIEAVLAEIEQAQQIGVTGVPFFVFASKLGVSGAQSSEVLAQAMRQASEGEAAAERFGA